MEVKTKKCYKMDRDCNESCSAFSEVPVHGTRCLELSTGIEANERAKQLVLSNEVNALNARLLSGALNSFKETFKNVLN